MVSSIARRIGACLLSAALTGYVVAATPAAAQQAPPGLVSTLPVTVVLVRVVGPWTSPQARGISRIVGIADGTKMRLFVQWIADAPQGAVLVDTREIAAVAGEGLVFGDVRVEASENDASVFLDTLPGNDGLRDTYVLLVQTPGQFRFGPATN
jgi:hypothetical protein